MPSVRFDEIYTADTNPYFASNIWVPSFARCRLTNDSWKSKRFCPFARKMLLNLVAKINLHTFKYHYMTSHGYIIMIIVDFCMILFQFDCIMQLKKSYHIATNVCSRKMATTFGDLPDWLGQCHGCWCRGCMPLQAFTNQVMGDLSPCLPGAALLILTGINNHIHCFLWDVITHTYPYCNFDVRQDK